jgi:hypothetical protein
MASPHLDKDMHLLEDNVKGEDAVPPDKVVFRCAAAHKQLLASLSFLALNLSLDIIYRV